MSIQRHFPALLLVPIAFFFLCTPVQAKDRDGYFAEGLQAFRDKQYFQAIKAFKQAEALGKRTASLYYNLGASYFKTGELNKAKRYFTGAARSPKLAQISHYNLGLIALRENNEKIALDWFYKASSSKGNPKITALANSQIDNIENRKKQVRGGVLLAYGRDDNVLFLPDNSPSQTDDNYFEIFAYLNVNLPRRYELTANISKFNYSDINAGDYDQLKLGINRDYRYGKWQLNPELAYIRSEVGGIDYLDILDVRFSGKRRLENGNRLDFRVRYSDISERDAGFRYLAGDRQQFRIEYRVPTAIGRVRYRYQLELNNRNDLPTASYSPTRHEIRARVRDNIDRWQLSGEIQYRISDYPDVAGISRSDDRLRLQAGVATHLEKQWYAGGRATYTDNDSNLASETYQRNDVQIYTELRF